MVVLQHLKFCTLKSMYICMAFSTVIKRHLYPLKKVCILLTHTHFFHIFFMHLGVCPFGIYKMLSLMHLGMYSFGIFKMSNGCVGIFTILLVKIIFYPLEFKIIHQLQYENKLTTS